LGVNFSCNRLSIRLETGFIGILVAFVIFSGVKEPQKGISEPEMEGFESITITIYKIRKENIINLFKKRSLVLLYILGALLRPL